MAYFEFPHTRTYDTDLGCLIRQCKTNADAIEVLNQWRVSADATIEDFQNLIDNIERGIFPEAMATALKEWIVKNFYDIVADMTKMVFFGLTDSGYFVAYIPESWDEVTFKTTGLDYTTELQPEFGHLVLQANYYTHSI